jgi:hypothetical protein
MMIHTFIRSFHSSVLHLMKHSSNTEQLYSPSVVLNPKDTLSVGRHFNGALIARWGLTQCELKRPSFGCLNIFRYK